MSEQIYGQRSMFNDSKDNWLDKARDSIQRSKERKANTIVHPTYLVFSGGVGLKNSDTLDTYLAMRNL